MNLKTVSGGILAAGLVLVLGLSQARAAIAGPHLTLTPSSGTYALGTTFKVTIGVNSGSETSTAVDVWGTFDAAKLEIVSIDKSANPAFPFVMEPHIYNDSGKFDFSCSSTDPSSFEDKVISGELAVITFKAKSVGTANVNYSCLTGSTIDSNIFKTSGTDVIDCPANQGGVYTITQSTGGDNDSGTTATATPTTAGAGELPQTGSVGQTIMLMAIGLAGILAAVLFKAI